MTAAGALLVKARDILRQNTDLHLEIVKTQNAARDTGCDALGLLKINGKTRRFAIQCHPSLQKHSLGAVIHYLRTLPEKGLLIADYINPVIADQLKAQGIPFLDLAGNAYINEPPVFVYLRGQKPRPGAAAKEPRGAAYRPGGMKVVFALLCESGLVGAPLRRIARKAGVALGTVGWVMRDLKASGFIVEMGKQGLRLVEREKLLKDWVLHYPTALRPKLLVGRYSAQHAQWWNSADLSRLRAYWGGEVAAARLTRYLKPVMATIYTLENPAKLIVQNRLREDRQGQVEILRAFWGAELVPGGKTDVPPLLVYADLLANGNPRDLETARMIYDRELAGPVRQN